MTGWSGDHGHEGSNVHACIRRRMAAEEDLLTYPSLKAHTAGEPYLEIDDQIKLQRVERTDFDTMTDNQLEWRP